ncbi:MAG: class II aldolase/adducin family protein [Edaphobacter sp.]
MASNSRRHFLGISAASAASFLFINEHINASSLSLSTDDESSDKEITANLVMANHILANEGVLDGYGHVSTRLSSNSQRYLLSRSLAPELVAEGDLIEYNLDSQPEHGDIRPQYLERFIHGEIYRSRPDVNAIVHCHSPAVIPFGVSSVRLMPIYHMAAFIGQGVPVFDIRSVAGMSNMIIRNASLGAALAHTLGDKPAALMRGHGAVIVGSSLRQAVGRSVYLQLSAKLQMEAMMLGGKVEYLSPEESKMSGAPDDYRRAWSLWKRKVSASSAEAACTK